MRLHENKFDIGRKRAVRFVPGVTNKEGTMAGKLEETLVVRISKELKRELDKWALKNHTRPGGMARRLLETALSVEEEPWQLPSTIKPAKPAQDSPRK
jgi:hypothetical protein